MSAIAPELDGHIEESISRLRDNAIRIMGNGIPRAEAVYTVLEETELDDDVTERLVMRGLMSYVETGLMRGKLGDSSAVRFRGGSQIAPGKKSEWLRAELKYPVLARVTYLGEDGTQKTLLEFGLADWIAAGKRDATTRKNAALREGCAKMAIRALRDEGVSTTNELKASTLSALNGMVEEAWRR